MISASPEWIIAIDIPGEHRCSGCGIGTNPLYRRWGEFDLDGMYCKACTAFPWPKAAVCPRADLS